MKKCFIASTTEKYIAKMLNIVRRMGGVGGWNSKNVLNGVYGSIMVKNPHRIDIPRRIVLGLLR